MSIDQKSNKGTNRPTSSSIQKNTPPQPKRRIPPILGNYVLGRLLGSGYSGSIFKARHIHNGSIVALKLQDVDHECRTNLYERYLYPYLLGAKGMPTLWAYGEQDGWDYLAIDLLGSSLDSLFRSYGGPDKPMDIGTVCTVAMQMIARLETMHARGILHRDIQLGNAVIGRMDPKMLYMIDFGFSKHYIDPYTRRHIPESKRKRDFIGNYWFSSVDVHCRGKVPSRRDDMEATALMLIHILTPRGLLWTRNGVPKTEVDHDIIKGQKRRARPEDLCRHLPVVFEEFLRYCRSLKFYEQPDYRRWIEEFRELKIEMGYGGTDEFIWPPPQPIVLPSAPPPPYTSRGGRAPTAEADDMEGILNGLRNLDFNNAGARQILGDRTNIEEVQRRAKNDDSVPTKEVIDISDSSEEGESKASRLIKLTARTPDATDNAALGVLVRQFILALKCNSSRQLTKDASAFLDALYKQLADPSVFVAPTRTSQQWSDVQRGEREPAHIKLGVVARLKVQVGTARSNKDMAAMVSEFTRVTNKSTGRTITKDGFSFLEGLARRLEVLQ